MLIPLLFSSSAFLPTVLSCSSHVFCCSVCNRYLAFLFRYQLRLVRIFAQSLCVLSFLNYGQFVCLRIILCVYFCLFYFDVVRLIVYQCSVVSCLDVLVSRTTRYVSSWTLNSARSLTQDRLIDCVKVA